MTTHHPRRRDFISSTEAQRIMHDPGEPARLRQTLRLLQAGGRAQKRRCRDCGRKAQHCLTWVPDAARRVGSDQRSIASYWLCGPCHQAQERGADPG